MLGTVIMITFILGYFMVMHPELIDLMVYRVLGVIMIFEGVFFTSMLYRNLVALGKIK